MKLASLLSKNLIKLNLVGETKEDVFKELIAVAKHSYKELDENYVYNAVMLREKQQSTYLGKTLAMPHARIDGLNEFIIVCGISRKGVSYVETEDRVHFFVMILLCKTKIKTLLQTMGALATFFSNEHCVAQLQESQTADEFIKIIEDSNIKIKETLVAADIMQDKVVTLTSDKTLKEVIDIFFTHNISGAPVVDENNIVLGSVTEKDVISVGIPKYMSMMDNISFLSEFEPFEDIFKKEDDILVKNIMSKEFVFVHKDVSVIQLAFYFVHKNCRRIVVTDDDNKLLGIIMRKDLIRKVIHA